MKRVTRLCSLMVAALLLSCTGAAAGGSSHLEVDPQERQYEVYGMT